MNEPELAEILRRMHRNAPHGERSTAVHLFGIRYVAELSAPHVNINTVADLAGLSKWYTEVRKGIRLAKYVELNNRIVAHGLRLP